MATASLALMLVLLVGSPLVVLVVHAGLARLLPRAQPQKVALAACGAAGIPVALVLEAAVYPGAASIVDAPLDAAYALLVYLGLAYSYFHLFNMGETARRIRILREIRDAGSLGAQQIVALYDRRALLETRLDRLVATRQLALREGRYVLEGRFLYVAARIVFAWRRLLGFDRERLAPPPDRSAA